MPIYEYECKKCKAHAEAFQKVNDKPLTKCRKCGGKLEKKISAPGDPVQRLRLVRHRLRRKDN